MNTKLPLQLHWIVHEPARLGLMMMLAESPKTFMQIKRELGLTDGNIVHHSLRLEDVGYVQQSKPAKETIFRLTDDGFQALSDYTVVAAEVSASLRAIVTRTARV